MAKNRYHDSRWHALRQLVIDQQGNQCSRCFRSPEQDDIVLQVHHPDYIKGRAPWEYKPEALELLCKGCHGREHGHIRPDSGWDLAYEDDLGSLDGHCELCGTALRYAYHLTHPNWEPMVVGTNCCDLLTGTLEASLREQERKKLQNRWRVFQHPDKWQLRTGHYYRQHGKFRIRIAATPPYTIRVNGRMGLKQFNTLTEAHHHLFEIIESGELERSLSKKEVSFYRRVTTV